VGECSIQRSLDLIGDRWSILVLRDLFRGVRRFDELQRDLGIARPVLTDRLRKLVDTGVVTKRQYSEHPPRFEYRLTPMGVDLSPALVALMRWGDRWLADPSGPPTVLLHEPCGHPIDQAFVCWHCNETFTPHDIASTRTQTRKDPARAEHH
jgi:DNA-binding HxlR family transcriptional regulator